MTTILEQTEQRLCDDNIEVINGCLMGMKAFCILSNENKCIAIDKNQVISNQELNTIYLHELEHLECHRYMYDFETSRRTVRVREGKTKRNLVKKYIKKDYLIERFRMGYEVHDIAEELCLTEDIIRFAIEMYNER